MTLAFEAARRKVAGLWAGTRARSSSRAARPRRSTWSQTWGAANLKAGDRILLSTLEHHSNIVPWQLLRERTGVEIDVCPLTPDGASIWSGRTHADARAQAGGARACVQRARHDASRGTAVKLAHAVGAKILLDGCQAVARLAVDVKALGCDFYVCSAHKLYGPTGIGALWARADILDAMPPGRAAAR
jgi:cysteine desulfurase/selenocysteine lyase